MTTLPPPPPKYESPTWDRPTRLLVTVLLIVAGIYAVTLLAPVFQMLTIAFIIAFLMYAPARFITRHTPVPWALAVASLYLLVIGLVFFILLIFVPALVRGVNSLIISGQESYTRLQVEMRAYQPEQGIIDFMGNRIDFNPVIEPIRNFVVGTPDAVEDAPPNVLQFESVNLQQIINSFVNVAGAVTNTVTSTIGSIAGFLSSFFLAIFISLLILIDLPNNRAAFQKWIPPAYHREVMMLVRRVVIVWNGFFRGQVLIGIFVGLITYAQLVIMGISNAELLAIITGLISLIPTIGGVIALIPLGLVPLLQGSSVMTTLSNATVALLVVLVSIIINQIIWNLLAPKILGDALELPLPVIIVGVFIGAAVGGVLGAFLVAPAMGTIRVLLVYTLNKLAGRDPFPEDEEENVPAILTAELPLPTTPNTQEITPVAAPASHGT